MQKSDFYTFAEANQMWAEQKGLATAKTYSSLLSEVEVNIKHLRKSVFSLTQSSHLDDLEFHQKHDRAKYLEDKIVMEKWISTLIRYRTIVYDFLYELLGEKVSVWGEGADHTFTEYNFTLLYSKKEEIFKNKGFIEHKGDLIPLFFEKKDFHNFLNKMISNRPTVERSDLERILHLPEGQLLQYGLGLKDETIQELHKNGNPYKGGRTPLAYHLQEKYPGATLTFSTEFSRILYKSIN